MISSNMQKRIERGPSCPTQYAFVHIKEDIGSELDEFSIAELAVGLSGLNVHYFLPG